MFTSLISFAEAPLFNRPDRCGSCGNNKTTWHSSSQAFNDFLKTFCTCLCYSSPARAYPSHVDRTALRLERFHDSAKGSTLLFVNATRPRKLTGRLMNAPRAEEPHETQLDVSPDRGSNRRDEFDVLCLPGILGQRLANDCCHTLLHTSPI
jgi:hypothetical protein